ncbi:hypothetical protein ACQEUU_37740 [Nonomuraea sp. CA-218870]|uniref:hypothetical protein n=1 Tax=Nonomuraea sp. CA-218870 TaxID=3239998 RepID=UPI003D8D4D0D
MARSVKPPPLAPVDDVTIPQWQALIRVRRRVDVVRSAVGRVATLAGACAAASGLFSGDLTGAALLADAALTLGGLATLRLWKPDGQQKAVATVLYLAPGVSLGVLLLAERMVPGIHWGEAAALTVWTAGVWAVRPARLARRMLAPPPPRLPAPAAALDSEAASEHPATRWWAQNVAVDGGAVPGTVLDSVEQTGPSSVRVVIRSAAPGHPVPDVSVKALSALLDVPEDLIDVAPVPGRGASYRLLTIGRPEDHDPASEWARRIAPAAMPGAVLTGVRIGRPPTMTTEEE